MGRKVELVTYDNEFDVRGRWQCKETRQRDKVVGCVWAIYECPCVRSADHAGRRRSPHILCRASFDPNG